MSWPIILNVAVQGALTGLIYGLMALGLSVIFGVVRVVNFAHGEFTVVAMYAAYVLFTAFGVDPFVALVPIAAALFGFFRFTRTGTAIRACADNLTGALAVGLNIKRLYALTFGMGLACVGAAGALLATVADAKPGLAQAYTLLAFVIVIVGG